MKDIGHEIWGKIVSLIVENSLMEISGGLRPLTVEGFPTWGGPHTLSIDQVQAYL